MAREKLTRRQKRLANPLESAIERRFVDYVHRKVKPRGLTRKMNGLGFRDWPDRLCIKPRVKSGLWVELKRRGKGPTTSQAELHQRLRALGQVVVVCDTYEKAIAAYEAHR